MSIGMGWDVFARLRYIYLNRCTLDTLRDGPRLEPTWMDGPLAAAGINWIREEARVATRAATRCGRVEGGPSRDRTDT